VIDRRGRQSDRRKRKRLGPERRRGRPALVIGQTANTLTIRLGNDLHDAACQLALRSAEYNGNVSAVIRDALARFVCSVNTPIATPPTE
jgi:hypothetical protein